jgi:hypothetical protein
MIISVLDNNKILIKTNEINHGKTNILRSTERKGV